MSKIKGSVIIPVYNQYDSLCKVLNGFEAQDTFMEEYEIIIIDDGSSDFLANETSLSLQKNIILILQLFIS